MKRPSASTESEALVFGQLLFIARRTHGCMTVSEGHELWKNRPIAKEPAWGILAFLRIPDQTSRSGRRLCV